MERNYQPRRTNVFLYTEDHEAIATIKQRYGVSTDSDAMRLALRTLAREKLMLVCEGRPGESDTPLGDLILAVRR